jgi:hypothetical protein
MMFFDEQVIRHEYRQLAGWNSTLPPRSVEPSHPDKEVVVESKIDPAFVRIRVFLVLPLQIPEVAAWIPAPESRLELRNGVLVLPRVSHDPILTLQLTVIRRRCRRRHRGGRWPDHGGVLNVLQDPRYRIPLRYEVDRSGFDAPAGLLLDPEDQVKEREGVEQSRGDKRSVIVE